MCFSTMVDTRFHSHQGMIDAKMENMDPWVAEGDPSLSARCLLIHSGKYHVLEQDGLISTVECTIGFFKPMAVKCLRHEDRNNAMAMPILLWSMEAEAASIFLERDAMLGRLKNHFFPELRTSYRQVPSDNGNSYSSSKLVLSSSRINTRLFSTSHFLSCRHPCYPGQVHYLLFRDAVGMAADRWSGEWQSFARVARTVFYGLLEISPQILQTSSGEYSVVATVFQLGCSYNYLKANDMLDFSDFWGYCRYADSYEGACHKLLASCYFCIYCPYFSDI